MLKNKFFKYSLIISVFVLVLVVSSNFGLCGEETHVAVEHISMRTTAFKFLMAMVGVVISSLVIYGGLTIYNNFFVRTRLDGNSEEDLLKTPHSVDEALTFFIKKNRMK